MKRRSLSHLVGFPLTNFSPYNVGRGWKSSMNRPGQKTHIAKDRRVIVHALPFLELNHCLPLSRTGFYNRIGVDERFHG
jgi:hypothetical protein